MVSYSLAYLNKQLEILHLVPSSSDDKWLPLLSYKSSLSDGDDDMRPPERPAPRTGAKRGRGAKRKLDGRQLIIMFCYFV